MKLSRLLLLGAAFLAAAGQATATNFITTASQGAGASWTQAIWRTSTADTILVTPTAGNTYEAVSNGVVFGNNTGNTRLRNPAFDGVQTFPGDSLTLNANTEIRFKRGANTASPSPTISLFPGVGGNPGLILNGGVLNSGDDVSFIATGRIHVASESFLSAGDNGGGSALPARAIQLAGTLTGPGALRIIQSHPTNAHIITTDGRGFTGDWIVDAGFLRGATSNSLGLGNIIIAPTNQSAAQASTNFSRFEVNYNIKSRGTLILDSGVSRAQFLLHQDVTFAQAFINGVILSLGTHPYSELAFSFPGNFPAGGSGSITVAAPPAPTSLVGTPGFLSALLSWTGSDLAAGYVIKRSLSPAGPFVPVLTNGPATSVLVERLANTLTYYFTVSAINDAGESADSAAIAVTPNFIPAAVTTQPVGATNCPGVNVIFNAGVTGHYPTLVQWFFNRTNVIAGATNTTLTVNNAQPGNSGGYSLVASNNGGSSTSAVATLLINPPTTATGPANVVSCPGVSATFTVTAVGAGPFNYTWRFGTNVLQGPSSSNSFTVASPSTNNAGTYTVEVAGTCGRVTNSATLSIATAPVISAQPANQTTPMGNSATFSATATAVGAITYQWQASGANIPGATGSSFVISNATLVQDGGLYQVIITSCAGAVTSTVATLTVTPVAGISFDFDTPGQFTNAPYYLTYNDWISSSFNTPPTVFESPIGGTGAYPGSGALDLLPNTGTGQSTINSAILLPISYDFSLPGKALAASVMIKVKSPTRNAADRSTQIGFSTSTNSDLNNNAGFSYMSVILQQTVSTSPTYDIRQGSKPNGANTFIEGNSSAATLLTVSNWYKLSVAFVNSNNVQAGIFTVAGSLLDMGRDGRTPAASPAMSFGPVTITNVDVTAARRLSFVLRGIETTGLDLWDNVTVSSARGPIAFVQQPQSQTVTHGRRAVFKALVDGDGPYTYQWSRNGTPVPGARSWKYVTPPATINDIASQYTVTVTGPNNTITSGAANLSVQGDLLRVTSVGSVDGTTVGVLFNQPVQQASAENAANYSINGVGAVQARLYRTSVGPLGPEGVYVILTPATLISAVSPFTVTVQNVQDLSGNAIAIGNSAQGLAENLTGFDVNPLSTAPFGENYSFASGQFIITGGGADIFGNADGFRYVYTTRTGDFDVFMKVPYMDVARQFSKAGIVARPSLDPFSPSVTAAINPVWPGANRTEGNYRTNWNSATGSWGSNPTFNLAWFPDAWLRLRRTGNTFLRYSSTNGINWIFDGQVPLATAFPDTVFLGLAVCAAGNNNAETVQIENFRGFQGYAGATVTITVQPTNTSVSAGAAASLVAVGNAISLGTNIPSVGELTYTWQRTNSASGGWTNLPGALAAGGTNNTASTGPLFSGDNGSQFRVIVFAPGAPSSAISSVATIAVTDTTAPLIASVNGAVLPSYPVSEVAVTFTEPVSVASATNAANYTVTNASGTAFTVLSATLHPDDPRTVVLRANNPLPVGNYTVVVNNVRDLNNNLIGSNSVSAFRSFNPSTAPVVVEVYQDVGANTDVPSLTGHQLFTSGTPTFISYSNLFGFNVVSGFASVQDNYGVKAYTYFVPPTNGQYKFWIRSDDAMHLRMNTNGSSGTSALATVIPSSTNSPVAERAPNVIDDNPNTKYLNFDTNGTAGFTVTPQGAATIVRGLRFTTANDAPERDPLTFVLEGTTGSPTNGPWTLIASNLTGLTTTRFATAPDVLFSNATAYTSYRLTFPTLRNTPAVATSMQISEVAFLNAAGQDVTAPSGVILIAENTGANGNYTVGTTAANSITNITLAGGQPYYMEALLKEGGGGDGFSVTWTDPSVTAAPAVGSFIPTTALAYPSGAARPTPVIMDIFTGYQPDIIGNGNLPSLTKRTNYPSSTYIEDFLNYKYIANVADVTAYQPYFAAQPSLADTRLNNYIGRIRSYFVPPTNGNYRFYLRSDDAAQFFMNTNPTNSTDPAGARLIGRLDQFISAYTVVGTVSLVGGQRYYMEALWSDGTGGDGVSVAVRAESDTTVPPIGPPTETIPASMLEYPLAVGRAGAVTLGGILPNNPTVREGESVILTAAAVGGAMLNGSGLVNGMPYGFIWLKNGVRVMENSFTNITPPLTLADNGSVYTFIVTNTFSSVQRSVTVTVLPDTVAPTIVRTVGRRYNDGFSIQFSEPVNASSATFLGNYQVSGGLKLLKATLDPSRTIVSFDTSPQAANTLYTVTVNRVRDASAVGNQIAANTTASFSTWAVGGNGFLVEVWTNIPGTAIADLTGTAKFVANIPDVIYYTNVFGFGRAGFAVDTDLDNFGLRITGTFVPTNTAHYKFFLRSDDASMLFMNINSTDSQNPAGRVMLVHQPSAGQNIQTPAAMSVAPVPLNAGQPYYIEALLKEGIGGDYLQVTFRTTDANGNVNGLPVDNTINENISAEGLFGGAPGDSGANRLVITEAPPATLSVTENTVVNLTVNASITASIPSVGLLASYQWQKLASGSTFTNIPAATSKALSFAARLADNNSQYRVIASIPGTNVALTTLLRVTNDVTAPTIVSSVSLDGKSIGIRYNELVNRGTAEELLNYTVNGGAVQVLEAKVQPDGVSVSLKLDQPITGTYTVVAEQIANMAAVSSAGNSTNRGRVLNYFVGDVGAPPAVGSSFSSNEREITVVAGGNNIWGTSDVGHLTLRPMTGDFDVWARIADLPPTDPARPSVSKGGVMVRQTLNADSVTLYHSINPALPLGRNLGEVGLRPAPAAATAAFNNSFAYWGPDVPNAWVRAQRRGDVFNFYRSGDGQNWVLIASGPRGLPNTVYVGLATCAHTATQDPNLATTVQYRDVYLPDPPTILTNPAPASRTVAARANVSYSVVASNPPNSGTLVYQWLRDGVAIPNATSATLNLNNVGSADSGVYTVNVGNDGGATGSQPVTLTVNAAPVAGGDSIQATQNVARTISTASLLGNDTDPSGGTLSILEVSGRAPVIVSTNFNDGVLANATAYGSAGQTNAYLRLNDSAGNQGGSIVINDFVSGRQVSAFTASFRLRIGEGSGQPADGFSFNFAGDLPDAATTPNAAEQGGGTGFTFAIDSYQFVPIAIGNVANAVGGTVPNTSGMKINYNNRIITGVSMPTWNTPRWVPVSITVLANGAVTVLVDGTNVFPGLVLPGYAPRTGRFGIYARTGGEYQTHWIDDLSITALSPDTAGGGTVRLGNNVITYTPPATASGPDSFFYIVSNGQPNGLNAGQVSVNFAAPLASKALFVGPALDPRSASLRRGAFSAFFGSTRGTTYVIEYKNSMTDETWTPLTRVVGTGDLKSFTDPGPLPPTRFYRVRVE